MIDILEDFAGPGGWDEGARLAGSMASIFGREIDADAVATAEAAGHTRKLVSVLDDDPSQYRGVKGYISSPPCQTFSNAGNGAGRRALQHLIQAARLVAEGMLPKDAVAAVHDEQLDERSVLVLEPLRVIMATSPGWVAMEQVPNALPVVEVIADLLRENGYHVRTGVVYAEEYGVPQTRKRAILVAVDTELADEAPWPTKTHSRYHNRTPDRLDKGFPRWLSMRDALTAAGIFPDGDKVRSNYGTGGDPAARGERSLDEPAFAVTGKVGRNKWVKGATHMGDVVRKNGTVREIDQPSPTITGALDNGNFRFQPADSRVTVQEAGVLQSFGADYPWQGTKSSQYQRVGDAIPPVLAAAVLTPLLALSGLLSTEQRTAEVA